MIKILFVCHGNICRSPMAEFILKDMVGKKACRRSSLLLQAPQARRKYGAVRVILYIRLQKQSLQSTGFPARGNGRYSLKKSDYEKYDYIIAMDNNNIRNIFSIIGTDPDKKVYKLLEFAHSNRDVADPWYTGKFDITYRDIYEGCEALLNKLL